MRSKKKRLNLGSSFTQLIGSLEQQGEATAGPGRIVLDVEYPPDGIQLHYEGDGTARVPAQRKPTTGDNIVRLMKECDWSYKTLDAATGLDSAQIWRHAHDKVVPRRKAVGEYNQAFAKKLKRPVSIS